MPEGWFGKKYRKVSEVFEGDSKLSLEAVREVSGKSADHIAARPTEELKKALRSRVPGKGKEIDGLDFYALFKSIQDDQGHWGTTAHRFIEDTVVPLLGAGDDIEVDIVTDWTRLLNPEPPLQVPANVANVIETFVSGDKAALQEAITALDAAGAAAAHETISRLLERFWAGNVAIRVQGLPHLSYINNTQFVGNLESFNQIFERINGNPQEGLESLEQVVPEAAEVDQLAEEIGPMFSNRFGTSLCSYLDPLKSMLGTGLSGRRDPATGAVTPSSLEPAMIKPFMIELKGILEQIKKEQDEEKQKALLGQLGKKIQEGFPKLLSSVWSGVKSAGSMLATGFFFWGAMFAFYLPVMMISKIEKEVKI